MKSYDELMGLAYRALEAGAESLRDELVMDAAVHLLGAIAQTMIAREWAAQEQRIHANYRNDRMVEMLQTILSTHFSTIPTMDTMD